jgi:putative protein kinase ArgK-like GTPase of G3E family
MAMIDELLFIKKFRENKAEKELQKARLALQAAREAEQRANEALQTFQQQAEEAEMGWYRELCSRLVTVRDIANVQEEVAMLRQSELEYQQAVRAAQQQHTQAQTAQTQANHQLREASKAREKFTELARNHHLIVSQEAERKEELELEEVSGTGRKNQEWGDDRDD